MATIAGTVSGVQDESKVKVVIYCYTGGKWWVQPYADNPYTDVQGGKWSTDIHLGHQYAALLVNPSTYKPTATAHNLPGIGHGVLARVQVNGRK